MTDGEEEKLNEGESVARALALREAASGGEGVGSGAPVAPPSPDSWPGAGDLAALGVYIRSGSPGSPATSPREGGVGAGGGGAGSGGVEGGGAGSGRPGAGQAPATGPGAPGAAPAKPQRLSTLRKVSALTIAGDKQRGGGPGGGWARGARWWGGSTNAH